LKTDPLRPRFLVSNRNRTRPWRLKMSQRYRSRKPGRGWALGGVAVWVMLLWSTSVGAQQTASITGDVVGQADGRPLASAQVVISGTGIGAVTNAAGRYLLQGVPAGEHQVQVQLLGYAPVERTINVQAGGEVRLDFEMRRSALALDEVVVTGAGQATARRQLGNTIETISAADLEARPIASMSEALQARSPGVMIQTAGGGAGQGSQIRIRGQGSLSQSNEPIIYVDGVRIDASPGQGQGQSSRLDDINPASIERIEVLKGAAAATLYGTEASSGVIQIFTKGGQSGAARWSLRTGGGFSKAIDKFYEPLAGFVMAEGPTCSRPYGCDVGTRGVRDHWGLNVQPYEVFSVSLVDIMLETGRHHEHSLEVSGGTDLVTYHIGGRYSWEDGIVGVKHGHPETNRINVDDLHEVYNLNANFSVFPTDRLRLNLTSRYTSRHHTPIHQNDESPIALNQYAKPEIATFANPTGWTSFMSVRDAAQVIDNEDTSRFGGSLAAYYSLTPDINMQFVAGLDVFNEARVRFHPFDWSVSGTTTRNPNGRRELRIRDKRDLSFEGTVSWASAFGESLTSSLVVGAQALMSDTHLSGSLGQRFPGPGLEVTEAASIQSAFEQARSTVNLGVFAQEQIGYRDNLFVTVGLRYDQHSAFGAAAGGALYPKASVSFIPSATDAWNDIGPVSSLRLRAAVGQSGLQPGAFDAFTTWAPLPSVLGPGLTPANLGNPDLKPEVSTEWEGGFESGFYNDRFALEATYWNRTVTDALVARGFAPSGGFLQRQLDNIGQLDAQGVDIGINGMLVDGPSFSLDFFANGAYLQEKVTSMGGAPSIRLGGTRTLAWVREGFAPSAIFGGKLADAEYPYDLERDGQLSSMDALLAWFSQPRTVDQVHDVLLGLQAPQEQGGGLLNHYLGKPTPNWQGSFGATMRFLDNFTWHNTFEYAAGDYVLTNRLYGFRTSNAFLGRNYITDAQIESTLLNPASTPQERVEAAKIYAQRGAALDTFNGVNQVRDASLLRWRETSLSYRLPGVHAARLGADMITLNASVRNVQLWTDFGWDPEMGATLGGGLENADTAHGLNTPRRFNFSVAVNF